MKHTPGPWQALVIRDDEGDRLVFNIRTADGHLAICDGMGSSDDFPDWEESEENARLMAASPDLLAACEGVVRDIEAEHGPHDQEHCPNHHHSLPLCFYCVAKAATAKANGES